MALLDVLELTTLLDEVKDTELALDVWLVDVWPVDVWLVDDKEALVDVRLLVDEPVDVDELDKVEDCDDVDDEEEHGTALQSGVYFEAS